MSHDDEILQGSAVMAIASVRQSILNELVFFQHDPNPMLFGNFIAAFSHFREDGTVALVIGFATQDEAA